VNASRLHAHQKVGGAHGRRDIEGVALQAKKNAVGQPRRGFACRHQFENVLEMGHADRVIEAFTVDRQARMFALGERAH